MLSKNSSTWNKGCVKYAFLLSFFFFSCKSINKIENYRIVSFKYGTGDYFLFKSKITTPEAKYWLRKNFELKEDEKLNFFKTKLFENLDLNFTVSINFDTDLDTYKNVTPGLCDNLSQHTKNSTYTFVKIIVKDNNGKNCLSTHSLFYSKTKAKLLDIKNNIKKEDYLKPMISE